jgi:hypothetical protein
MRKIVAILLLINLSLVGFYNLVQWTTFILNQEKITEQFCVNKEKPELKCNGKCHLAKQLENEEEQTTSPSSLKRIHLTLYFSEPIIFSDRTSSFHNEFSHFYSSKLLNGHLEISLPPPQA